MGAKSIRTVSVSFSVFLILAFSVSASAQPDESDDIPSVALVIDELLPGYAEGQGEAEPGQPGGADSIGLSPYNPETNQDGMAKQPEPSKGLAGSPIWEHQKEQPLDFSALTKVAEPGTYPWCTTCRVSVHKSAQVQWSLQRHRKQIRMIPLPTYSPDLNRRECLNNDVKANAVGRCRPSSRKEMMAAMRVYLRSTQMRPNIVKGYFCAPSDRHVMD